MLVVWLLCACSSQPAPAEAPPPAPPSDAALHAHMAKHLQALSSARDAVIAGDLDAARTHVTWLTEHEAPSELPEAWTTYVASMQSAASAATKAEGLGAIAVAVAQVASECGSCHTSMGKGPLFETEPPSTDDSPQAHMIRHHQASERMWEGLIGGDARRWQAGAQALAEQEPLKDLAHPTGGSAEAAAALGQRVHTLGAQGLADLDRVAQATLYGQLIATCSACHGG